MSASDVPVPLRRPFESVDEESHFLLLWPDNPLYHDAAMGRWVAELDAIDVEFGSPVVDTEIPNHSFIQTLCRDADAPNIVIVDAIEKDCSVQHA